MDTRTGNIYTRDEAVRLHGQEEFNRHFVEVDPNPGQLRRGGRIGRNEQCPCGSGKKFKHCHLKQS